MLLVLAKEIYECWLVAEDIILLTRKNYIYIFYSFSRKYICGKGSRGGEGEGGAQGGGLCLLEANDTWKYQIKWNRFHHMGPESVFFFLSVFEAILFFKLLSTTHEPFYFFLAHQEPMHTCAKDRLKLLIILIQMYIF